ncbi:hypothetical protein Q1M64_11875 (plasmid) [Sinorhizobium meliloti]|nr:hypothetical protein Q1M64_11875 [Sinorhizobium meliloti]
MKTLKFLVLVGSLVLAGGGGYVAGTGGLTPQFFLGQLHENPRRLRQSRRARSSTTGTRTGVPECSAAPKQTADGRPFVAVRQSEDVSFEPLEAVAEGPAASERKNPRSISISYCGSGARLARPRGVP